MARLKIECGNCGKTILDPKDFKGGIQRFCSKKCRFAWHNRRKLVPFTKELTAVLKKYGYIRGEDG